MAKIFITYENDDDGDPRQPLDAVRAAFDALGVVPNKVSAEGSSYETDPSAAFANEQKEQKAKDRAAGALLVRRKQEEDDRQEAEALPPTIDVQEESVADEARRRAAQDAMGRFVAYLTSKVKAGWTFVATLGAKGLVTEVIKRWINK